MSSHSSTCPVGEKNCCDKVTNTFEKTFALHQSDDRDAEIFGEDICQDDKVAATADFSLGIACGKRDSRVYRDVDRDPTFTNPGEWPWAALIYDDRDNYVGAAALVGTDIVVTAAHKVLLRNLPIVIIFIIYTVWRIF